MNLYAAQSLARSLMNQHGLSDWRFGFDHARRRFGSCRPRQKLITLSRHLVFLNEEPEVRDTILHEIAHALTPGDGHGRRWKAMCRQVGARPERCYTDEAVTSPARRSAPYQIGCLACGWWNDRHRLTRRRLICKGCRSEVTFRERTSGRLFRTVVTR
ncbi:MAG TPA: SprT-like domain-containing protein [Tepidisphaeraceae bacterium]|nr:SprT-like domain-containing protein [Tepidisphaeraceae bacterium]